MYVLRESICNSQIINIIMKMSGECRVKTGINPVKIRDQFLS
jgi:hypothetical protein